MNIPRRSRIDNIYSSPNIEKATTPKLFALKDFTTLPALRHKKANAPNGSNESNHATKN